jgi:pyruvate dehydrogenase E2 component (dihydrolipoamide acetyltransferase)
MKKEVILATPAARRIAGEKGLALQKIPGRGPLGSITAADVNAYKSGVKATPVAIKMAEYYGIKLDEIQVAGKKITKGHVADSLTLPAKEGPGREGKTGTTVVMQGMRKVIAQRMMASLQTAPQYTLWAELDTTEVLSFLKNARKAFSEKEGTKLSFTTLLVKITALAIQKHPLINSSLQGNEIIFHTDINVGIAVALDDGLIVPVIKNAGQLPLKELNKTALDLIVRARSGKLMPDEYSGGTFTISNLGMYPVDFSTPIINQPESGILGVGRTVEKPVVLDGEIKVRSMTGFSLTLDHRNIDGAEGAKFLATFNEFLENPISVLLQQV